LRSNGKIRRAINDLGSMSPARAFRRDGDDVSIIPASRVRRIISAAAMASTAA
jgi:hypothetical protein